MVANRYLHDPITASKKRIVSNPLNIRLMTGFIRQHLTSAINEYHLMQLGTEAGRFDENQYSQPWNAIRGCTKRSLKVRERPLAPDIDSVRKKNARRDSSNHQKDRREPYQAALDHDGLGAKIKTRIEPIGTEAHYCQDYLVRQSIHPVKVTE